MPIEFIYRNKLKIFQVTTQIVSGGVFLYTVYLGEGSWWKGGLEEKIATTGDNKSRQINFDLWIVRASSTVATAVSGFTAQINYSK